MAKQNRSGRDYHLYLSEEDWGWLEESAARFGRTIAAELRIAVRRHLANPERLLSSPLPVEAPGEEEADSYVDRSGLD